MTDRPHVLQEVALQNIRNINYEVAMLTWGATEPHNYHLPFGTDAGRRIAEPVPPKKVNW